MKKCMILVFGVILVSTTYAQNDVQSELLALLKENRELKAKVEKLEKEVVRLKTLLANRSASQVVDPAKLLQKIDELIVEGHALSLLNTPYHGTYSNSSVHSWQDRVDVIIQTVEKQCKTCLPSEYKPAIAGRPGGHVVAAPQAYQTWDDVTTTIGDVINYLKLVRAKVELSQ